MTRKYHIPNMVQAITVLTVLKMLTNAESTCNQGLGRVVYERLPDQQLQGFDDEPVSEAQLPPFKALEKCQTLCLRDRTPSNLVRTCSSFDFMPGIRIPSFGGVVEYEPSTCYLTQASSDSLGTVIHVPNSIHYSEVCLSSSRIERECSNRQYVFERHVRKRLKLLTPDAKEGIAANRTECEEKCLNEQDFICRSANYDNTAKTCTLTRYTRRSHPELMEDEPNSDYLENTCLKAEKRCEGSIIFVKEENKHLSGPFEVDIYANISLMECQAQCLKAEKYYCRSVEYDEVLKRCIIFEEDSFSQKDDLKMSSSPTNDLYDLVCLDNAKGNEINENQGTSYLLQPEGRRPDTAFQRYRNSRLGSEFHSEINGRTLSECLDECLRQVSFQCHSAVYSERFRTCRLSRFNQRDGQRVIYDADYDYYENLMVPGGSPTVFPRPDPIGQAYHGHPVVRPAGGGFPGTFAGGSYPGYMGSGSQSHRIPYSSTADIAAAGYYPYTSTHGTDVSPFAVSPAGSGYHAGVTAAPGLGYPSASASPGYIGSPPPIGGASLGISSITPYPPQFGGLPGGAVGFHPGIDNRPIRCDEQDPFRHAGPHKKMRRQFVRKSMTVPSLNACEKECMDSLDFTCRSFNFRAAPFGTSRENCELSDRDAREFDMNNANYFDNAGDYDFYERSAFGRNGQDCLDVSQSCSEDGMEFTLRTPEGFLGRIYAHGYYDRCFYKGNGGQVNVLRISGAQGYPDCGTVRFGDVMTNIVVVQFSEYVQTSRDKRYNLTCLFRGPGEATVTSGYMTANSGVPVPIEYLPAENSLSSRVKLSILYQGRPVNTIAVGDPLTFRIDAQDGYNYANDIFATNVVAKDPYSGKAVQLIDRYGCPVDNGVFPALDKSREGDGLEAKFSAFKIPESNFLIFEATVKTCREPCTPAYCHSSGPFGRSEKSLGRKKRDVDDTIVSSNETTDIAGTTTIPDDSTEAGNVRDVLMVYDSREGIVERQYMEPVTPSVCLTHREYYGIVTLMFIFLILILIITIAAGTYFKRYWIMKSKNEQANNSLLVYEPHSVKMKLPSSSFSATSQNLYPQLMLKSQETLNNSRSFEHIVDSSKPEELQVPGVTNIQINGRSPFEDPSEPIYTDTSFFERCRSSRDDQFHYQVF